MKLTVAYRPSRDRRHPWRQRRQHPEASKDAGDPGDPGSAPPGIAATSGGSVGNA